MLLDPSWLLRKNLLDRHTGSKKILESFPIKGAVYCRQTKAHKTLMRLRSVQIHPSSFFFLPPESRSHLDLALEFDFGVIISSQYFFPEAELSKTYLHSTRTIV